MESAKCYLYVRHPCSSLASGQSCIPLHILVAATHMPLDLHSNSLEVQAAGAVSWQWIILMSSRAMREFNGLPIVALMSNV